MRKKEFSKAFSYLVGVAGFVLVFAVLPFQHCSNQFRINGPANFNSKAATTIDGGNGGGYDGKIYVTVQKCKTTSTLTSAPTPKGKIVFSRAANTSIQSRDVCHDVSPPNNVNISEMAFLDDLDQRFTYHGDLYVLESLDKPEISPAATVPTPTPPPKVLFNVYFPGGCNIGYCWCVTTGILYSCGASQGIPDKFCVSKGYAKAESWTCKEGPVGNLCSMTGCFGNQNPGNSACDTITCTN